ncbi:uncharacterized protein C12orf56-like [Babylonia areolata]|uniref:uncharacterized protein C12orf56-like n=1 Tax=Babylonia areolata TaxID=304850 RepID=UPI003FD2829B
MARGNQDIVKKNSKLESFLHRSLTGETFHRIRGYESCICVSEKENKAFKYVVLSDEWIYLTENPPKSIRGEVHLRDVIKVELINDYPTFLSGEEKRNTQHIAVTYVTSEPTGRRRSLRRSRHHRSPRGSLTDLRDRSNTSTPVGSLDGSEDATAAFLSLSTASLPRSRPTSRGSVGSQRGGDNANNRSAMISKKKKKAMALNESWDQEDSILRSLKEEIEEDFLEDVEEDRLSVLRDSHNQGGDKKNYDPKTLAAAEGDKTRTLPPLSSSGVDNSLTESQTSVRRPLPPQPKKGAFETIVAPPPPPSEVKGSDKAGVVLSPVEVTSEKSGGCSCIPFFGRSSKSQVAPLCQTDSSKDEINDFSSKTELIGDMKNGIPNVAVSVVSDDGRESRTSRQSSLAGVAGGGAGSRSATPSLDTERMGSFMPSDVNGSTAALHSLTVDEGGGGEQRQTVLHIYLLSSSSPMIMLMRGAWSNYLIRATLALDPAEDASLDAGSVVLSNKNQRHDSSSREKCELLFNQLKQQLFEPSNSMEDYFQLFTDLKRATQKNFLMKKLFWRSGDILVLMVQQLQKYMPHTEANLHTEEGRAKRVDELEFVILLVTTLSLMFRESEILLMRMQTLKAERGKYVIDLLMTLTSALNVPEKQILLMKHWSAPSKNTRFGSNSTLNRDGEVGVVALEGEAGLKTLLYQLLSEYIRVSITAVFELFLMAKQVMINQDEGVYFTVAWMVKVLEESKNTEQFMERVMSQVLEAINLARFGAVSNQQAVSLFQQFSLLLALLDHNPAALAFLRDHYHEEFNAGCSPPGFLGLIPHPCRTWYFIQGPALALEAALFDLSSLSHRYFIQGPALALEAALFDLSSLSHSVTQVLHPRPSIVPEAALFDLSSLSHRYFIQGPALAPEAALFDLSCLSHRYFIQGPALARKLPVHFPITPTTVQVVSQVSSKVLGQSHSKGSRLPR